MLQSHCNNTSQLLHQTQVGRPNLCVAGGPTDSCPSFRCYAAISDSNLITLADALCYACVRNPARMTPAADYNQLLTPYRHVVLNTHLGDFVVAQLILAILARRAFVPCGIQSPAKEARQRVNAGGTLGKHCVGNTNLLQLLLRFSELGRFISTSPASVW